MLLGYINECGVLNLRRFEAFLKLFARNDRKCFFEEMEDINYLNSKRIPDNESFRFKKLEAVRILYSCSLNFKNRKKLDRSSTSLQWFFRRKSSI